MHAIILEEREVPSETEAGVTYRMVRTPSGWQHADAGCPAWGWRGECRHVEELNMTTEQETGLVVSEGGALATMEALDDSAIVAAVRGVVTPEWVYSFRQAGQLIENLSVIGVEQAGRECAKRGEALVELDVRLEYEDEYEARFVAQVGRQAVGADGQKVMLDTAIRAKRQSKWVRLTPDKAKERGVTHIFDEHWYEKGLAKAVRNAKLALLPQEVKTVVLDEARRAGHVREVDGDDKPKKRPTKAEREAAAQPIGGPMTINEMMSLARSLGYKDADGNADEAAVLKALGYKTRMDISDPQADFGRLRDMAVAAANQKKEAQGGE